MAPSCARLLPVAVAALVFIVGLGGCLEPKIDGQGSPDLRLPVRLRVTYTGGTADRIELGAPTTWEVAGVRREVLPVHSTASTLEGTTVPYTAYWDLEANRFAAFGGPNATLLSYLPEHDFLAPSRTMAHLTVLGIAAMQQVRQDPTSATFVNGGTTWALEIPTAGGVSTLRMSRANGEPDGVRLQFAFDGAAPIPIRIAIQEWGLPWSLKAQGEQGALPLTASIELEGPIGETAFSFGAGPDTPLSAAQPPTSGLEEYGTGGGAFYGPPNDTNAFSAFPLTEALRAAALDPRVSQYVAGHPGSFVLQAIRRSSSGTLGLEQRWSVGLAPACIGGEGLDGETLQFTVRKTIGALAGPPIVDDLTDSGTCPTPLAGTVITWETLPKTWADPTLVGSTLSNLLGPANPITDEAMVWISTILSCVANSPWGIQVGIQGESTEAWASWLSGGGLVVRSGGTSGAAGTGRLVQLSECPPSLPTGSS